MDDHHSARNIYLFVYVWECSHKHGDVWSHSTGGNSIFYFHQTQYFYLYIGWSPRIVVQFSLLLRVQSTLHTVSGDGVRQSLPGILILRWELLSFLWGDGLLHCLHVARPLRLLRVPLRQWERVANLQWDQTSAQQREWCCQQLFQQETERLNLNVPMLYRF